MRVVAVVPVQAFSEGKSRLAKVLSTAERTALIERMLGRVLKALQGARLIDGVVVVSPELDV
ncbi:MAG: Guanylyl transferase CofC like, partial [Pseudomonadota bacterium]